MISMVQNYVLMVKNPPKKHNKYSIEFRHERDQSFLVPVPVRKKISSRSRRKKNFGTGSGHGGKKFYVSVLVPSETNLGAGPSQKYFGHGPVQRKFWSRSRSRSKKRNLVSVPPGPGPGPLCPSLIEFLFSYLIFIYLRLKKVMLSI
jgi:hypothetical protein